MCAGVNVDSAGDDCIVKCDTSNRGGACLFDGAGVVVVLESSCAALAAAVTAAADIMDKEAELLSLDLFPPPAVTISW